MGCPTQACLGGIAQSPILAPVFLRAAKDPRLHSEKQQERTKYQSTSGELAEKPPEEARSIRARVYSCRNSNKRIRALAPESWFSRLTYHRATLQLLTPHSFAIIRILLPGKTRTLGYAISADALGARVAAIHGRLIFFEQPFCSNSDHPVDSCHINSELICPLRITAVQPAKDPHGDHHSRIADLSERPRPWSSRRRILPNLRNTPCARGSAIVIDRSISSFHAARVVRRHIIHAVVRSAVHAPANRRFNSGIHIRANAGSSPHHRSAASPNSYGISTASSGLRNIRSHRPVIRLQNLWR
jgi:hypothetical protein